MSGKTDSGIKPISKKICFIERRNSNQCETTCDFCNSKLRTREDLLLASRRVEAAIKSHHESQILLKESLKEKVAAEEKAQKKVMAALQAEENLRAQLKQQLKVKEASRKKKTQVGWNC